VRPLDVIETGRSHLGTRSSFTHPIVCCRTPSASPRYWYSDSRRDGCEKAFWYRVSHTLSGSALFPTTCSNVLPKCEVTRVSSCSRHARTPLARGTISTGCYTPSFLAVVPRTQWRRVGVNSSMRWFHLAYTNQAIKQSSRR
jgi:hypothetical protein